MNNYYENLLELIEFRFPDPEANMFKKFITMLGEERFNMIWQVYFIDIKEDYDICFEAFHKSIRQTDFYEFGCFEHSGTIDMLFWDFINVSNIPYKIMKRMYKDDWTI